MERTIVAVRESTEDRCDEVTVELDFIDGQVSQVAQGRVAAAKVVERDADAVLVQCGEHGAGHPDVFDQKVFGDLDDQAIRGQLTVDERFHDVRGQGHVCKRCGEKVDAHRDPHALAVPYDGIVERLR